MMNNDYSPPLADRRALQPLREPEPRRLGELAADALRNAILTREFPANTRLIEEEISRRLRVSRGPVRDALRQLAEEGLVRIEGRGAFAVPPSLGDLDDLYSLRRALECLSMELAVQRFTDEDMRAAGDRLEAMLRAAHAAPLETFVDADLAFHSIFYERVGHRRLLRSWQSLQPTFRAVLNITNVHPGIDEVLGMHERLLEAVAARDADAAKHWVGAHLAIAAPILRAAFARFEQRQQPVA
jgi:DNA-binding GntR family transcriptional regulator